MEHTGYVRRGYDDGVWLPLIGRRMKITLFHPVGIPPGLNLGRTVFTGNIHYCFRKNIRWAKVIKIER